MKRMKKVVSFIMTVTILLAMSTSVIAGSSSLIPTPTPGLPDDRMDDMVSSLLGIAVSLGYAVAVGMMIYLGIKYTMASANEKADLKNSSIKYAIGAVVLFSVTTVFNIVENLMEEIGGSVGS